MIRPTASGLDHAEIASFLESDEMLFTPVRLRTDELTGVVEADDG